MDINIVINKDIYLTYKDEILKLNARIFSEPYFYDIENYKNPFDLEGIDRFIQYVDNVIIHATSSFLDYVNIILILAYLYDMNYKNKVCIDYYIIGDFAYDKAIITKKELKASDFENINKIKNSLINKERIDDTLPIPGSIGFNNFYNQLLEPELFIEGLDEIIEECNGDIDNISSYLENKYANMGLSKDYFAKLLEKYL